MRLSVHGRVAIRLKMLTYCVYAPLLIRIDALLSNLIWGFETISKDKNGKGVANGYQ